MSRLPMPTDLPRSASAAEEPLDPANQSLAEALRKSFRVLKLVMVVLVILYFLSGWFSVKPNERGIVLRCGRIVGATPADQVRGPGWHWSWPYPLERWETIDVGEREMPVEFLFAMGEDEAVEIKGYKYNALSPERDDYVITGDANILHVSLLVKYRISDPVAYVTNVRPAPDPTANPRSRPFRRYPEFTLLRNIVRDAVIETAAGREALVNIRGAQQEQFLLAVGAKIGEKLKFYQLSGRPLGLSVDPNTGVLAPKTRNIEAIMPPRQTQEVFDKVFSAQTEKAVRITKAISEAQELLLRTAGPGYAELSKAIDEEFALMRQITAAESAGDEARVKQLRRTLEEQRGRTEALLAAATGEVQGLIRQAQVRRDRIVKEITGDWERFNSLLPEYLRNPAIFLSRLRDETFATALTSKDVTKLYVPTGANRIWIQVPRSGRVVGEAGREQSDGGESSAAARKER